jgi:hypothetical protein
VQSHKTVIVSAKSEIEKIEDMARKFVRGQNIGVAVSSSVLSAGDGGHGGGGGSGSAGSAGKSSGPKCNASLANFQDEARKSIFEFLTKRSPCLNLLLPSKRDQVGKFLRIFFQKNYRKPSSIMCCTINDATDWKLILNIN